MAKRILACLALLSSAGLGGAVLAGATAGQAPPPAGGAARTLSLDGLQASVDILRDRWGVNHIYAANEHDLFFAQGYAAAHDRLFQFEMWRRQATGTVAEIMGPAEVKRDIGARLHQFRGDLDAELNWYHPHGKAIVTAYVAGVNAAVDEARKTPSTLPVEFRTLDILPEHWTPAVVISRHNALVANLEDEIKLAQAVHVLGPERTRELQYFPGPPPDLTPDPAVDLSLITKSVTELYDAFRAPLKFGTPPPEEEEVPDPRDIGSNNWVIGPRLTQSGYPMMMNDPHRTQSAPSLRYWVHLVAPGWNVIGAGEPVLPGVSIGHNERGAWGLTIFGSDAEDLYVYDTNPANPSQYRYKGAWEEMRVVHDTIPVKGASPVAVDLKYTRHGPVLAEDAAHHKAYALRAGWLEIGAAPYLASLRMDQASTWAEFEEACGYSRLPSENMVWADRAGHIGYQAVGLAPRRPNWTGLLPVPGDGRYEWDGDLPIKLLPHALDPDRGFLVSANNYLFPLDYPFKDAMHYTAADPFRASRITEVLSGGRLNTVADMERLQNDNLSIPARSLVPLLAGLPPGGGSAAALAARDRLLAWNFSVDADSVAAGIYEMWQRRIAANLRDLLVPKEAQPFITSLSMKKMIDWLEAPDGRFGEQPTAGRDALLVRSLDEAVAELTKKLGPDPAKWQWGQNAYHHALIHHPMSGRAGTELRRRIDVGPFPRGGDSYTVSATGNNDNQTSGGSFKIITDTWNWDNSVGLINPGQSGNPDSPHYRDLAELWARGRYFPVLFSRSRVESATEETLRLEPAAAPRPR
jgi:penicillin G amidase